MNEILKKSMFNNKTIEEIQKEAGKAMKEMKHPNYIRYIETDEDKRYGFSTSKLVIISSKEGDGKFFYSQWREYVGHSSYIVKNSKKTYDQWIKEKIKKLIFVSIGISVLIGLICAIFLY